LRLCVRRMITSISSYSSSMYDGILMETLAT
jgi:hypothetical protein